MTTGPVYIDGHLYMYVITGDLYTEEHWLKLMDLDIEDRYHDGNLLGEGWMPL